MIKFQTLKNKKGEVNYRAELYRQELINIDKNIQGTKFHQHNAEIAFRKLAARKALFSPYLDLGAGNCARSLVLENNFSFHGFAGDLSFDVLNFAPTLVKSLHFKRLPIRIVLDIYHLPFKDNSLPFIYLFQTLHHFPDPKPALVEIDRVLAKNGYLYIGEEPIRQTFNLGLWRRGEKRNVIERFLMAIGVLPFITRIGKEETQHGILEESFTLNQWKSFLSPFNIIQTEVIPFRWGPKSISLSPSFPTRLILFLLGGGINVLCQTKSAKPKLPKTNSPRPSAILACPDCRDHPVLEQTKIGFFCKECGQEYKIKDKILFLLPKKLENQLYGKI